MQTMGTKPSDYTYAVFHQPNAKFPVKAGKELGFKMEQIKTGLLVNEIGNTYAGAALIGLAAILDAAQPGDHILAVSFGSGAGSDAFSLRVTDQITARRDSAPSTRQYMARRIPIDYATYTRYRKKLVME